MRERVETRRALGTGPLLNGLRLVLALVALLPLAGRSADLAEEAPFDVVVTESGPGLVAFAITNRGEHPVRDVEVLISHAFLWNDERNPGANNPGRTSRVPIPDEIAPGETTRVSSPLVPPLPARTDGKFDVKIEVLRWTAILPIP
jgi:hypothetical protein